MLILSPHDILEKGNSSLIGFLQNQLLNWTNIMCVTAAQFNLQSPASVSQPYLFSTSRVEREFGLHDINLDILWEANVN